MRRGFSFLGKEMSRSRSFSSTSCLLSSFVTQQGRVGSVDLELGENIAHLCLNHPQKRNALSPSMMSDLSDHVSFLEKYLESPNCSLYGLVLTGAQNTFCSGFSNL